MKWLDDLPELSRRRAEKCMKARENAVREWESGAIPKELARLIVARCNSEIARIAGGAA
jgi:hypothetical protein